MKNRQKRCGAVILALALALALSACGGTSSSGATEGGQATVGMAGLTWSTLDPAAPAANNKIRAIWQAVYDTILRQDGDRIEPGLASGYEFSNAGKELTLTIRDGVKFQDGTALDAEAVKFNLERHMPPNETAGTSYLSRVKSIHTDGNKVVLELSSPDASLPSALATQQISSVVSPTALEKAGSEFGAAPVGAGPFEFEKQISGTSLTLKRFDGYWGGKPKLDGLTFTNMSDGQQVYNALTSGNVDYFYKAEPRYVEQAGSSDSIDVFEPPATGIYYIDFNVTSPQFKDVEARRAVAAAIDQEAISDSVFFGESDVTQSPFAPDTFWSPGAEVAGYPASDVSAARDAVRSLGGLSFTLTYGPADSELAKAVESLLREADMEVKLEQLDAPTLFDHYSSKNYQALIYSYSRIPEPDGPMGHIFSATGLFNGNYDSPKADELIAKAVAETDPDKRKTYYGQIAEVFAQDVPKAYLGTYPLAVLFRKSLHGVIEDVDPYFEDAWLS